jgi:hypothetical protein
VALLGAGPARADVGLTLPPTQQETERGFKTGDFLLIPLLAVEGRYNTNVFRQDSKEGSAAATVLTITPGLRLKNPNGSWLKLSLETSAGIHQYFSSDENATKQGRISAEADFRSDFFPKSVVGFFVQDTFRREVQPRNLSTSSTYDRNFNHAEAGIQVRPGGGALQFGLSYAFNLDLYDTFHNGDMYYHEARLLGTWDFLPKTTALLDVNFRKMDWKHPQVGLRENSMPLRAQLGVKGFITKKLAIVLKAGFGKGFYATGTDYQNFIGEASVGYKFTPTTILDGGYVRDFSDSYYANWYVGDSAFLNFSQQIVHRVDFRLSGKYTHVAYNEFQPAGVTVNQAARRDHALQGRAGIDVGILRYLAITAGYQFDGLITDFRIDSAGNLPDYGGYLAHQVFGNLSLFY